MFLVLYLLYTSCNHIVGNLGISLNSSIRSLLSISVHGFIVSLILPVVLIILFLVLVVYSIVLLIIWILFRIFSILGYSFYHLLIYRLLFLVIINIVLVLLGILVINSISILVNSIISSYSRIISSIIISINMLGIMLLSLIISIIVLISISIILWMLSISLTGRASLPLFFHGLLMFLISSFSYGIYCLLFKFLSLVLIPYLSSISIYNLRSSCCINCFMFMVYINYLRSSFILLSFIYGLILSLLMFSSSYSLGSSFMFGIFVYCGIFLSLVIGYINCIKFIKYYWFIGYSLYINYSLIIGYLINYLLGSNIFSFIINFIYSIYYRLFSFIYRLLGSNINSYKLLNRLFDYLRSREFIRLLIRIIIIILCFIGINWYYMFLFNPSFSLYIFDSSPLELLERFIMWLLLGIIKLLIWFIKYMFYNHGFIFSFSVIGLIYKLFRYLDSIGYLYLVYYGIRLSLVFISYKLLLWLCSYFSFSFLVIVLVIGLLWLTIISWINDLNIESLIGFTSIECLALLIGIKLLIVSEFMLFFGCFWVLINFRLNVPSYSILLSSYPLFCSYGLSIPFFNLMILLFSSWPFQALQFHIKLGLYYNSLVCLFQGISAGLLFSVLQCLEFVRSLWVINDGLLGSILYFTCSLHGIHVVIGCFSFFLCIDSYSYINSINYSSIVPCLFISSYSVSISIISSIVPLFSSINSYSSIYSCIVSYYSLLINSIVSSIVSAFGSIVTLLVIAFIDYSISIIIHSSIVAIIVYSMVVFSSIVSSIVSAFGSISSYLYYSNYYSSILAFIVLVHSINISSCIYSNSIMAFSIIVIVSGILFRLSSIFSNSIISISSSFISILSLISSISFNSLHGRASLPLLLYYMLLVLLYITGRASLPILALFVYYYLLVIILDYIISVYYVVISIIVSIIFNPFMLILFNSLSLLIGCLDYLVSIFISTRLLCYIISSIRSLFNISFSSSSSYYISPVSSYPSIMFFIMFSWFNNYWFTFFAISSISTICSIINYGISIISRISVGILNESLVLIYSIVLSILNSLGSLVLISIYNSIYCLVSSLLGSLTFIVYSLMISSYIFMIRSFNILLGNSFINSSSSNSFLRLISTFISSYLIGSNNYNLVLKRGSRIALRSKVNMSLITGLSIIDSLIPVGRGQRQLVLGDRYTGKTSVFLGTVLMCGRLNGYGSSDGFGNSRLFCIYCGINQNLSKVNKLIYYVGRLDWYCLLLCSHASSESLMSFMLPVLGVSICERLRNKGYDSIICIDDLSKHSKSYRQLSLILGKIPSRDAFPSDIFNIHSSLLERCGKLSYYCNNYRYGSISSFPIIETINSDITEFIATNIISITDGQFYCSKSLFNNSVRPSIDSGLSVSRIGSAAQCSIIKYYSIGIKNLLTSYRNIDISNLSLYEFNLFNFMNIILFTQDYLKIHCIEYSSLFMIIFNLFSNNEFNIISFRLMVKKLLLVIFINRMLECYGVFSIGGILINDSVDYDSISLNDDYVNSVFSVYRSLSNIDSYSYSSLGSIGSLSYYIFSSLDSIYLFSYNMLSSIFNLSISSSSIINYSILSFIISRIIRLLFRFMVNCSSSSSSSSSSIISIILCIISSIILSITPSSPCSSNSLNSSNTCTSFKMLVVTESTFSTQFMLFSFMISLSLLERFLLVFCSKVVYPYYPSYSLYCSSIISILLSNILCSLSISSIMFSNSSFISLSSHPYVLYFSIMNLSSFNIFGNLLFIIGNLVFSINNLILMFNDSIYGLMYSLINGNINCISSDNSSINDNSSSNINDSSDSSSSNSSNDSSDTSSSSSSNNSISNDSNLIKLKNLYDVIFIKSDNISSNVQDINGSSINDISFIKPLFMHLFSDRLFYLVYMVFISKSALLNIRVMLLYKEYIRLVLSNISVYVNSVNNYNSGSINRLISVFICSYLFLGINVFIIDCLSRLIGINSLFGIISYSNCSSNNGSNLSNDSNCLSNDSSISSEVIYINGIKYILYSSSNGNYYLESYCGSIGIIGNIHVLIYDLVLGNSVEYDSIIVFSLIHCLSSLIVSSSKSYSNDYVSNKYGSINSNSINSYSCINSSNNSSYINYSLSFSFNSSNNSIFTFSYIVFSNMMLFIYSIVFSIYCSINNWYIVVSIFNCIDRLWYMFIFNCIDRLMLMVLFNCSLWYYRFISNDLMYMDLLYLIVFNYLGFIHLFSINGYEVIVSNYIRIYGIGLSINNSYSILFLDGSVNCSYDYRFKFNDIRINNSSFNNSLINSNSIGSLFNSYSIVYSSFSGINSFSIIVNSYLIVNSFIRVFIVYSINSLINNYSSIGNNLIIFISSIFNSINNGIFSFNGNSSIRIINGVIGNISILSSIGNNCNSIIYGIISSISIIGIRLISIVISSINGLTGLEGGLNGNCSWIFLVLVVVVGSGSNASLLKIDLVK